MDIALIIAALTFMITINITPGPNNILCAFHGSKYGVKATIPLISGMALGWLIMGLFVAITLDTIEKNRVSARILDFYWSTLYCISIF